MLPERGRILLQLATEFPDEIIITAREIWIRLINGATIQSRNVEFLLQDPELGGFHLFWGETTCRRSPGSARRRYTKGHNGSTQTLKQDTPSLCKKGQRWPDIAPSPPERSIHPEHQCSFSS
ncbi:MAG: hypothetical protein P4L94_04795 [Telmatospirillum sp.]|nr:hypothetical protein [Telmatospirillum sp.]